ncbi:MAG: TRAP transporter small permease [Sulfuriferula multivorans]|jgi:TRAP-type C4-dicarboxylate transport system permease small subunit|uniref:TRAP transporter small permease protein n=1 Tax=Sulfuriferula multivorans TaxID=1559896 RepID=A0A7C9JV10_9PROT|nr:TRAP transporter small permease [Sulfuriferula multivorans]
MRKFLDFLYDGAGWLAALFMIGTLAMVLANVLGRMFNFNPSGSDAYAGYFVAAVSFLTLAHTLKRGEHIRVTLILQHVGAKANRALEIACHVSAVLLATALAWFSIRLVWQSYTFHDISQSTDATPLWIPQLSMAIGATLLAIAFIDELVALIAGHPTRHGQQAREPARME